MEEEQLEKNELKGITRIQEKTLRAAGKFLPSSPVQHLVFMGKEPQNCKYEIPLGCEIKIHISCGITGIL